MWRMKWDGKRTDATFVFLIGFLDQCKLLLMGTVRGIKPIHVLLPTSFRLIQLEDSCIQKSYLSRGRIDRMHKGARMFDNKSCLAPHFCFI